MTQDKLSHPAFPQPSDPTIKVWRYMNLAKLLDLLRSGELHLSNLRKQQDKYEGMDPPTRAEEFRQMLARDVAPANSGPFVEQLMNHQREFVSRLFINCWRMGNDESEAMWRLYVRGGEGVAVQTTYLRLVSSLAHHPHCYIGCVKYINPKVESFDGSNIYRWAMHKRSSFSYESEVRIVLEGAIPLHTYERVSWNPQAAAERIVVSPYAKTWFFETVRDVVGRYSPSLAQQVEWSEM